MPNFKDTNNKVYFIEDVKYAYLLPDDCVAITDEEAELLQIPPPELAPTAAELLSEADKYMSRVSEDSVVLLLSKGIIARTDFPQIVWDRINYRRSLRNQAPI